MASCTTRNDRADKEPLYLLSCTFSVAKGGKGQSRRINANRYEKWAACCFELYLYLYCNFFKYSSPTDRLICVRWSLEIAEPPKDLSVGAFVLPPGPAYAICFSPRSSGFTVFLFDRLSLKSIQSRIDLNLLMLPCFPCPQEKG